MASSQWPTCFTTALSLNTKNSLALKKTPSLAGAIDQGSPATVGTGTEKITATLKKNRLSKFYNVLPADMPSQERPEAPPEHRSVLFFGFIIDHWFGFGCADRARKYGKIYHSGFLVEPMHFVTDMNAIVDIHKNAEFFTVKGSFKTTAALFGENSIFLMDGPEHAALRSTVAPAFSSSLFPFFFDTIRRRVENTWAQVHRDVNNRGKVKLDPVFRQNYLSIVVEMTTGIDMQSELAGTLLDRFGKISKGFFSPQFGPLWDAAITARDETIALLGDLVRQNLSENQATIEKLRDYGENLSFKGSRDIRRGDVNVLLITIANSDLRTGSGSENDPQVIHAVANLMMLLWFAGYATSAATTFCAAFEMGMDQAIWAQLAAEQDGITAAAGGKGVTYAQVNSQMPLLDSFINEMLRMHPAAGGALRVATQDLSVLGKFVGAGDKVFLDYKAAMRDGSKYPDPDTLKVDRFLRKEGELPAAKVIGFGAPGSAHYCLGAGLAKVLMKTTLAILLRGYTLELDPRQTRKYSIIPDDTPRSKVVVQKFSARD